MKIIREKSVEIETKYYREFQCKDDKNSGFSFECTKEGNVVLNNKAAAANYQKCLNGEFEVTDLGIIEREHRYSNPKIGICDVCGQEVLLTGFTNTCDCGVDYNLQGHMLAPREQWGGETGEDIRKILSVNFNYGL